MDSWDVYLVTEDDRSPGRSTQEVVEAALAGGVDVVQLREKGRTARERYHLGRKLRERTRAADVPLVVNDRVDLAEAVDADGVHLGDGDMPVEAARDLLGDETLVGRSVSFVDDARRAVRAGADYLSVGSVYETSSKGDVPIDEQSVGTERVADVVAAVNVPVVAIGGVTPERASAVVSAGADGVAVISAVTTADDPEAATADLRAAVETAKSD